MANLTSVGDLMHLYLEEIDPGKGTSAPEFLINASAQLLNQDSGRNWVPVIVKETGEDQYEVIGNSFVYAVAEEAGLERIWCIIADEEEITAEISQVLAGEKIPKISLSTASRDEIKSALEYLKEQPSSALKGVDILKATNRIDEAPRQYWDSFNPIKDLKCGITQGKKLNALKEVFYLTPEPMPEIITDPNWLGMMTVSELKKMAKKRKISGYSSMKKPDLVKVLSQEPDSLA